MAKDIYSLIKPGMNMTVLPQVSQYDYDYWNGRLLVWEEPKRDYEYVIGLDTAEGVGQDRSVCEVIRMGTLQVPDMQVAEFASDFLDPIDFADCVNTIGRFYADKEGNEAFVTVETNNPAGASVLNTLRSKLDYSNFFVRKDYEKRENLFTTKYGWHTTRHNRGLIIARGLHAFQYGDLLVNSPFLLDEMADFESDHDLAQARVKRGKGHDDRIMATLIGYFGGHDDEWLSGDDVGEQRRLLAAAGKIQEELQEEKGQKKKADYQNTAISYKEMMRRVDDWFS